MSRRLFLFRHGKSDWNAAFASDHERPLSLRGERDAQNMGMLLASSGTPLPQLVICSTAVRARSTLDLALRAGDWAPEVVMSEALYATSAEKVLQLIRKLPAKEERVMLVGHEPTWSELICNFTGGRVRMPTAAMARLDFPLSRWEDLDFDQGELVWLLQPRFFRKFRYTGRRH
ncbi:MAG: histidine phosphatase family protein [Gammaproteobacteria bacterium]|nr:MAG: histidine phosphatase family protein [Gammaproteobacteria bacterium]